MTRSMNEYLPLVRGVARRFVYRLPAHMEFLDLVSIGTLGLLDAAAKYDPCRQTKFETYATWRVRGAIMDEMRFQASRGTKTVSLIDCEELIDPDAPDPFSEAGLSELKAIVAEALSELPKRERVVLLLYYYREMTMKEVGQAMGLTEARISQIHKEAIIRLRVKLAGKEESILAA